MADPRKPKDVLAWMPLGLAIDDAAVDIGLGMGLGIAFGIAIRIYRNGRNKD
ncbi:hypothetical protein [Luteimonas salinilitoris]|uniref:Uncharacterized protein n=1 Tax=Luteimonas salinilitoris TaxID=3237697 RepID=A0ABV4HTJ6_9GAMM